MDFRTFISQVRSEKINIGDGVKVFLRGGVNFIGFYYGAGESTTDVYFHKPLGQNWGLTAYPIERLVKMEKV